MPTYGKHIKSLEVDGLVITESVRFPGETLPRHSHNFTNISLVLDGTFHETVGARRQKCEPNNLVIRPGGEFHTDEYGSGGARSLIIEVLPGRMELLRPFSPILNQAVHFQHPWLPLYVKRIYREFRMKDSAAALSVDSLLLDLLSRLVRSSEMRDAVPIWFLRAKDYLNDQFRERIRFARVAEIAGVHPSHLSKAFRKYMRTTAGNYVRRLRLEFASHELSETDRSLTDIAITAGFFDQSHFAHCFKSFFGVTPSEFRALTGKGKFRTKRHESS